ncbi:hypothetical protein [Mycobacterium sp.]|jgi:hypothetical protein|uniref:hypothetical protein n=1 Tax=Mycobacterium sp. TaxID=1785 RepID=UPI003F9586C5
MSRQGASGGGAAVRSPVAGRSEQLGVLRREGVVVGRRHANTVTQSSASPHIAERLAVSRTVLSGLQSDQVSALERSATDT